jgi:predicted AlkP superfamily pyrophosphatase or phosphodiesterase
LKRNRRPITPDRLCILLCLTLALLLSSIAGIATPRKDDLKPTVILISLDGFRADYLEKYRAPNLSRLAAEGVRARWLIPSFPSLTFPNHYTIATGLYPQHHGIVNNEMYDPVFDATFAVSDREALRNGRWWGGEPIWVTAEKQGQHAGVYFFLGSEAKIEGVRPTYWKPYDGKVPNSERVDTVLSWLDLPTAQRPTFLALYFSDMDTAGHGFGPDSPEVGKAVAEVDTAVGRLIQGLRARNIYDQVNIIVVSDHGMATVAPTHVVILDNYFDSKEAAHVVWGDEVTSIFPRAGEEKAISRSLKTKSLQHARCYLKRDIPARFHYRNNRRIGAIVCMADEGWKMFSRDYYESERQKGKIPNHLIGAHGYDNRLQTMRAIFIAHGEAFKRGVVVRPFRNIDIYDIMARILRLRAAKNDGSLKTAHVVLH